MKPKGWLLLLLSMLLCVPAFARRRAVGPPPSGPCTEVRGLANLYISRDGGQTFTTNREPSVRGGSWDIAVFEDEPERVLTVTGSHVFDSPDGGCTWSLRYTITEMLKHPLHVVAGSRGRGILWTEEFALRYDSGAVTPIVVPEAIGLLAIDPGNPDRLRLFAVNGGAVYESTDGGANWTRRSNGPGGFVAAAGLDPSNFDHVIVGVSARGLVRTRDGGRTWGDLPDLARSTLCRIEFVKSRPNVVWVTVATRSTPFVYRSTDGGGRFESIGGVSGLENNLCLTFVANPHNPDDGSILFGTRYEFDAVTKRVDPVNWPGDSNIVRIGYSPADPNVVYVYAAPR